MSMFWSTTRHPTHMVVGGTRYRWLTVFAVFGALVAWGSPPVRTGSFVDVSPSVQVEPFKQQFRLQERITFILKNNSVRPLYFYCGLEAQVGGQWREAATDVRLPFGSKMAQITPVPGHAESTQTFQPLDALGEHYGRVSRGSRCRLKCWYGWSVRDRDSEDRVVRSRVFEVVP